MKIKILTTCSDKSKCFELERSLRHFNYDCEIIVHEWHPLGFLGKIHQTYKYLKALKGYTHFLYTDAWDTFALAGPEELQAKMPEGFMISAERACYPHGEKAEMYPKNESPWHFVNGGGWAGEIEVFLKLYETYPPTTELNDQVWLTDLFLKYYKTENITLDYNCRIFQTVAFCPESDFKLSDRVFNTVNDTYPIFIHGNGHTSIEHICKLIPIAMDTLKGVESIWRDTIESHKLVNETFTDKVNADPKLKEYRDWIESKIFGFGERSFLWMWKLLIDEIPEPNFLEIGVFRGQILGLIRLLSPNAKITGITPLTSEGGHWESDYEADIKLLHDTFKLKQPIILKGLSTDEKIIEQAGKDKYDILYVDGGHSYEVAKSDVFLYSSFVKVGGYLVVDDCSHKYKMPEGYFPGIEPVSRAVDELLPNEYYKEVFSVVHNRVFKRIK